MSDSIVMKNVSRKYGNKNVLNKLNFSVSKGSVYGLLGKNGAGKTTTIRILMGLIRRDSGEVSVLGHDPEKEDLLVKEKVGYVAENPDFYDWLTVEETIGLVANYRKNWDDNLCDKLISAYNLDRKAKVGVLSKGGKTKLSLLLALSHNPKMLILDEPTTGLDPSARRDFMESVLQSFSDEGKTVFISSHLVNEISGFVDHVGILKGGKLLFEKNTEELINEMKTIRLIFPNGDVPENIKCSGLLNVRAMNREVRVTVREFNEKKTIEELNKYSPENISVEGLSLEDIFIELLPNESDV